MPDHTIEDFIGAFGLVQKGKEYVGPCPICKEGEDRFHVKEGNGGKPTFGCRVCIDGNQDTDGSRVKEVFNLLDKKTPATPPTTPPRAKKEPPKPQALPTGAGITTYHYVDAEGKPVFAVNRHDPPSGKKYFKQWTPAGVGLWIAQGPKEKLPLYLLPEVKASTGKVAIVEGEKCVHACKEAWPSQVTTYLGWRKRSVESDRLDADCRACGVVIGRRG